MTLYRKYRPQKIDELDLEDVRETLKKISLKTDTIPHAFLFSGPKGSGKTSAARVLAKVINCENPRKKEDSVEPCNKCSVCTEITNGQSMDVVEMDAASNRGIDDIRALRENIALSPVNSKRKIYILDEAHMLTTEAANAFLKTLEEPPEHAFFVLATTDPQKLPDTVRSRLTPVKFRKATIQEIKRQLRRVKKGEGLDVDNEALTLIAKRADGSFRDAVKIFENLTLESNKITEKLVSKYLSSTEVLGADEFLELLMDGKQGKLIEKLNSLGNDGGSVRDLIDDILEILRERLVGGYVDGSIEVEESKEITKLVRQLMMAREELRSTLIQTLPLELLVVNWVGGVSEEEVKKEEVKKEEVVQTPKQTKKKDFKELDGEVWSEVLKKLREDNASIETLLRSAKLLGVDGSEVNLEVYYEFHKERLESSRCREVLSAVISDVSGLNNVKVVCNLVEAPKNLRKRADVVQADGLTENGEGDIIQAAKEIFGG